MPGLQGQELIERTAALERQEPAATNALGDAVAELDATVKIETSVLSGDDVAQALLDAAQDHAGLLVLGSRGYGPVRRTLHASVSVAIVRAAPIPVIVVPRGVEPGT